MTIQASTEVDRSIKRVGPVIRDGNRISFNLEMSPNLYALATARVNASTLRLILEGVYHMNGGFIVTFHNRLRPQITRQRQPGPQLGDRTTVTVRTASRRDATVIAGHEKEFGQQVVGHFKTNQGLLQLQHGYMHQLLMSNLKNTTALLLSDRGESS